MKIPIFTDINVPMEASGTERCENHHRLFDVRLLDDPDTEAHVRDKGYETDARLDDSVVGGSQAQLCL